MPDCRCYREGCPNCSPLPNLGISDTEYRRAEFSNRRGARPRHTTSAGQQQRHHDLQQIFDDLNRRYFAGAINATIAWRGRQRKRRRARKRMSITLGRYKVETRQIFIHHGLDRADVPRFFVAWIVYHEMLHQVHPIQVVNGRRVFHSKAFRDDEACFAHYGEACRWERHHLFDTLSCP